MIFCTRKRKKEKLGIHKQISLRSFKQYSVDEYEKALGQVIFPNYERNSNTSKAYNNFFHNLIEVVNRTAPLKNVRIKNASSEWFDTEITKKLSLRDKLFKKFKSSRLNIFWEIYKEARNDAQRLIKHKKKKYFEEKLAENIAKPQKKLWQALKLQGFTNKKTSQSSIPKVLERELYMKKLQIS